eukprot:1405366-Pleurochrysis_carterae.AAC.2
MGACGCVAAHVAGAGALGPPRAPSAAPSGSSCLGGRTGAARPGWFCSICCSWAGRGRGGGWGDLREESDEQVFETSQCRMVRTRPHEEANALIKAIAHVQSLVRSEHRPASAGSGAVSQSQPAPLVPARQR